MKPRISRWKGLGKKIVMYLDDGVITHHDIDFLWLQLVNSKLTFKQRGSPLITVNLLDNDRTHSLVSLGGEPHPILL